MLNSLDILRMKYDEVKHEVIFVQQFLDAVASLALGHDCPSVLKVENTNGIRVLPSTASKDIRSC